MSDARSRTFYHDGPLNERIREIIAERDAAVARAERLDAALQRYVDDCDRCDGTGTVEANRGDQAFDAPCPGCDAARVALGMEGDES